jgi:predicted transcriptional regulator
MYDVRVSDSLYRQASQAAQAQQVSLEAFAEQAVQLHFHEPKAITLTAGQMADIRNGQAEIKAGKFLATEQVEQRSAANKVKWLEENQP